MGSSGSKAAQSASKVSASGAARKYPSRSPPLSSKRTNPQARKPQSGPPRGPQIHPETHATDSPDSAINLDAADPDIALNDRLRTLGPVNPNPTQSNSSTFNSPASIDANNPKSQFSQFQASASNPSQTIYPSQNAGLNPRQNPAVSLLTARYRLAEEAEEEFATMGRSNSAGRQFLDVLTIRQILIMREKGESPRKIEERMRLREGVVGRLGSRGVIGLGSYA